MKKLLYVCVFILFALVLVSCQTDKTVEVSDLVLSGLTGEGTVEAPYELSINLNETTSIPVVITPLDLDVNVSYRLVKKVGNAFQALTASDPVGLEVLSTSNKSKLDVKGLIVGEHYAEVKIDDTDFVVYVKITVVSTAINVTAINFPLLTGSGTATSPYFAEVAYSQTAQLSFTVTPNNATNKVVNWEVVKKDGSNFVVVTNESEKIVDIESATVTRITIEGVTEEGKGYIRGTAADNSGVVVYVEVSIVAFTPVASIESTTLLAGNTSDYVFKTAVGTQWDMSGNELDRKAALIAGTAGPGGGQAADDMTYWPSLYNFNFVVAPETATNPTLIFEYSVPGIITVNADGTWEALKAGTTVVTVKSFTNPNVEITIEVEVLDSLYPGILQSAYDALTVSENSVWDFDDRPDNLRTRPLIIEWQLVQMQTNSFRGATGDDGNQKMFYLGQPDRIYGIALESRVDNNRGDINKTTALMWNKVAIGSEATTMELVIGNNDKVHNQYRIVIVTEDKQVFIVRDWTSLTVPNGSSRVLGLDIPAGAKGKTVAVVIEQRLTEKANNAELHIKGIWINQYTPVTSVQFSVSEATYGQGASFNLNASVSPSNATDKRLTYVVTPASQGVTVDATGKVTIASDATVGEYSIRALSLDNTQIFADFTLIVDNNVPLTSFSIKGIENNQTLQATHGIIIGGGGREINLTDAPLQLSFMFNEGASNQSWTVNVVGSSVSMSDTGLLTYLGVGSSEITITPQGNPDLAITFTVDVQAYDEANLVAPGVQINMTEAMNKEATTNTSWTTKATVLADWQARNINRNHGGSKVADFTDGDGRIVFEGHATAANLMNPINQVWTKVLVDEAIQSFTFKLRSHDDDRILESTNFRVRVVTLGETPSVVELIGWTTVAGRWKQYQEWFNVTLDISSYQGQEIIILIEQTGSLQNNGNWPRFSDSGAGAYLHFRDFALLETAAPSLEDIYHIRQAFTPHINLMGTGWTAVNNPYKENVYDNGMVKPFSLTYGGPLDQTLTLSTTTPFIQNSSQEIPMFYMWGLYPALNNNHQANNVVYELADPNNTVLSLDSNVLTVIGRGQAELIVKYLAFGSTTEYVSLVVVINSIAQDHIDVVSVDLPEVSGSYVLGSSFQLNPIVLPVDATDSRVTFSVTPTSGVTVSATGLVQISLEATPGEYSILVTSVDDETKTVEYILTVLEKPDYYDVSEGVSYKFEDANEFESFVSSSKNTSESNYAVLNKTIASDWNICLDGGDCDGIQAAVVLSGADGSMEDLEANSWISIKVLLGSNQALKFVAGTDSGAAHFLVKVVDFEGNETILTEQQTGIWQVLPGGYNQGNLVGNYDLSAWEGQVVTVFFMYDHFETSSSRMFLDSIQFVKLDYVNVAQTKTYKFETAVEFNAFTKSSTNTSESNYAVLNKTVASDWNICLDGGDCDGIQAAVVLSGSDSSMDDLEANSWISIKVKLGVNQVLRFVVGTDSGAAHFLVKVVDSEGIETILTEQQTGMWQVLPGGYNQGNLIGNYNLSTWDNQIVTVFFMYDHFETSSSRIFLDTITFNYPSV